jgi:DNA repair protein RecO (recombination protein O)
MPLGEADRLVTILTAEYGLVRAIVPGARKPKSRLRGRSELFVVNQLLIVKGRSLDKVIQADTLASYSGLSLDAGKLAGGQYLAEMVLCFALSEQPQNELYEILNEHLRRLESLSLTQPLYAHLAQAVFHLLAIAGIAPQVYHCCLTHQALEANFAIPNWRVGFSFDAGGLIQALPSDVSATGKSDNLALDHSDSQFSFKINKQLTALELTLLQQLGKKTLPVAREILPQDRVQSSLAIAWIRVERLLRDYAQYHLGRAFLAATLVDALAPLDF